MYFPACHLKRAENIQYYRFRLFISIKAIVSQLVVISFPQILLFSTLKGDKNCLITQEQLTLT